MACKRLWAIPYLIEAVLGLVILVLLCVLPGCGVTAPVVPSLPDQVKSAPPIRPQSGESSAVQAAAARIAELNRRIAADQAELDQAKRDQTEARLAPLRTSLLWIEGLAVLAIAAGIALAVATAVWGLGFGLRPCLGIAAAGIAVLAVCLSTSWALDHVSWMIAAVGLTLLAGIAWLAHRHISLAAAAAAAWDHVPPDAPTAAWVDQLLDRLGKSKA